MLADSRGRFKLGIRHFSCRVGGVGQVRDYDGREATLPVIDPCGSGRTPKPLSFKALAGRVVSRKVTVLLGLGNQKPVTMRQGDALQLWEQANSAPEVVAEAPNKFLELVATGAGVMPFRGSKGRPGFSWRWIAMTAGHTAITLCPACGLHPRPQSWVMTIRIHTLAIGP